MGAILLACRDFQWVKLLLFVAHNEKGGKKHFLLTFFAATLVTLIHWWREGVDDD